ncbi:unnamed protein product [Miscanthus lutarioriparius]|uniref:Uncharacterized protein n=1 Tax=Miscanthus lutarioriparius TaxID=422564 RepID=A0A811QQI8_9POAL|nr:unnamed protein product [Miscanthus lutarioriparius]
MSETGESGVAAPVPGSPGTTRPHPARAGAASPQGRAGMREVRGRRRTARSSAVAPRGSEVTRTLAHYSLLFFHFTHTHTLPCPLLPTSPAKKATVQERRTKILKSSSATSGAVAWSAPLIDDEEPQMAEDGAASPAGSGPGIQVAISSTRRRRVEVALATPRPNHGDEDGKLGADDPGAAAAARNVQRGCSRWPLATVGSTPASWRGSPFAKMTERLPAPAPLLPEEAELTRRSRRWRRTGRGRFLVPSSAPTEEASKAFV